MTTFIKANLKKSDDQTNIDKYRVAASKYYRISYYIQIQIILQKNYHSKIHDQNINMFKMEVRTF